MITSFETITHDLSDYELSLVPMIIDGFRNHRKRNPIKSQLIIATLNASGVVISGARLRKICNYIRSNSLLPLIATSDGYFVSFDPPEIKRQIQSLQDRANAILSSANGLQKFVEG